MLLQPKAFRAVALILALSFAALACAQSGQILPDAEATQLVLPTATVQVDVSAQAEYQVGETVTMVGGDFGALVPLYGQPGSRFFSSQVPHGEIVEILQLGIDEDGVIWYSVEGLAGSGWIWGEHIAPLDIDLSVDDAAE